MKKLSFVFVLLLVVGTAVALPSYSGLRGLNRVVDARTSETGLLSIGLFTFMGISPDERTAVLESEEVTVTDTEYSGTGYITLGYGVSKYFELGTRVSYLMNQIKREDVNNRLGTSGDWNGDDGFSEAGLFLKFALNPDAENVWFSVMPWAQFSVYSGGDNNFVYNGDEWDGIWNTDEPMFQLRRPMMNSGDMSFGGDLLATMEFDAVTIHGNLGYHYYKQNFVFTDSRYDANHIVIATEEVDIEVEDPVLRFAAGIEYPMNKTTLFAELEWRHFLNREFEEGDGERFDDCIQIAPGARFEFDSGFAMDVTGSYCISSFDPEYNDLGHRYFQNGVNQTDEERARYAPFPTGYAPQYGIGVNLMYSANILPNPSILSGTVTDASTGEVIAASVTFPGSDVEGVNTDAGSGMYTAQLDKDTYTILVAADGYISASETLEIPSGENITKNFALQSVDGTVTGTVTDAGTGEPIEALVAASGSIQSSTDLNGEYSIECAAGTRTFTASAAGYSNLSRTVDMVAGESVAQDFQLSIQLNFENVYFDTGRHNLRPDAKIILDRVAQMLVSNPGVSVMITGNTDSDGTPEYNQELAENRALSVRNYLISKDVSELSLSTVGYGEDRPAAPNTTDENKALNRRSEFTILAAPIQ
ncbi:MAG: OmpA family protein [Candidatus Sabulitectum sp.]|nr:OmpA family protein [Candidatus Sabulitectum sp.]